MQPSLPQEIDSIVETSPGTCLEVSSASCPRLKAPGGFLPPNGEIALGYLGLVVWLGTPSPFLLVHGGSMEPTLHAGDLLLNRKVAPAEIREGDVIAFSTPDEVRRQMGLPATLVHRVVSVDGKAGQLVFVTKGDNSDTDRIPVPSTAVRGVLARNLGVIGKPLMYLTNIRMLMMFGLPVVAFIIVAVLVSAMKPSAQQPASAPGQAAASSMHGAIERLADATAEYGAHLQSHTGVVKGLAATTRELRTAVSHQRHASEALRNTVAHQNRVLRDLQAVTGGVRRDGQASGLPESEDSGHEERGAKAA